VHRSLDHFQLTPKDNNLKLTYVLPSTILKKWMMEKTQKLTVPKSGVDLPHSETNGTARCSVPQKRMTSRPVSTVSSSKWSVKIKIISNTEYDFRFIEQKETGISIIVKKKTKKKRKRTRLHTTHS